MLPTALLWLALTPVLSGGLGVDAPSVSAPAKTADYRLGPADVLAVSVLGLAEFTQPNKSWIEIVVSNSGKIHVPYLGVLRVNDLTPAQVQDEITRQLREQDLLKDPQVTVRVLDYRGQTIYILGEVMQPGQYYMRQEMYLLDLIGLSQSFPNDGMMYLYRRAPVGKAPAPVGATNASGAAGNGGTTAQGDSTTEELVGQTAVSEAIPINIRDLADGKRPELNVRLQGGDVLYVPYNRPKYFYATGAVNNAGAFEIPPGRSIRVSQAVSMAGGPMKTAKMSKGILVRYDTGGAREELALDFDAILRGKAPDFPVEPNDIIFIPGSNAKTLGYGLLGIVPTLVTIGIW